MWHALLQLTPPVNELIQLRIGICCGLPPAPLHLVLQPGLLLRCLCVLLFSPSPSVVECPINTSLVVCPSLSIYGDIQLESYLILVPLELIEEHIRQYHAQGFSFDKMVPLLKKHYDNEVYGLGSV